MRSVSLYGKKRNETGSSSAKTMRRDGFVPCVVYGNDTQVHFYAFINDFKEFVYTPETFIINLDIEGEIYPTIIQETQFHPLSEELIHADFLMISEDTPIKVELPLVLTGASEGVKRGGKLQQRMRKLKVKALPQELPSQLDVDVTKLGMGKSIRVKHVNFGNIEIITPENLPIATVDIPRTLKGEQPAA